MRVNSVANIPNSQVNEGKTTLRSLKDGSSKKASISRLLDSLRTSLSFLLLYPALLTGVALDLKCEDEHRMIGIQGCEIIVVKNATE